MPNDFYEKKSHQLYKDLLYDPCGCNLILNPLFYIPFKDNFPLLDDINSKNKKEFSLLYVQPKEEIPLTNQITSSGYPLQTMFECYNDSIPSYNYNEFKTIVMDTLHSSKSNDEILDYFLETFGYGAIEFLTEIIRHRNNKIDYSTPIYGKL